MWWGEDILTGCSSKISRMPSKRSRKHIPRFLSSGRKSQKMRLRWHSKKKEKLNLKLSNSNEHQGKSMIYVLLIILFYLYERFQLMGSLRCTKNLRYLFKSVWILDKQGLFFTKKGCLSLKQDQMKNQFLPVLSQSDENSNNLLISSDLFWN